jgi:glyoxylate/hydroxypyruvate reductase A
VPVTVVVATYLEPELVARIAAALPDIRVLYDPALVPPPRYIADHTGPSGWARSPAQEARFREWLAQADVLFDFDRRLSPQLPELAPRLRWIQSTSSGIGPFLQQTGLDRSGIAVTNAAGIHAIPLAEHAVLSMLYFCKELPRLRAEQAAHRWERYCGKQLRGQTVAVVGMGNVGREIARLSRAMGLRVLGVKRTVAGIDPGALGAHELFAQSDLPAVLPRCDYLVLMVPHTPETEGMIGAAELALLPAGAVLINLARGVIVDQDALVAALQNGHLGGAALDVARHEPLEASSPLWDMPNVLITPHSASTVEQENERLVDLFCQNLERFAAGQPLINLFPIV